MDVKLIKTFVGSGYGEDLMFSYSNNATYIAVSDGFSLLYYVKKAEKQHQNIIVDYSSFYERTKHKRDMELVVEDDNLLGKTDKKQMFISKGKLFDGFILDSNTVPTKMHDINIRPLIKSFKLLSTIAFMQPDESFNVEIFNGKLIIHNHMSDVETNFPEGFGMEGLYNYFTFSHVIKSLELLKAENVQFAFKYNELFLKGKNFIIVTLTERIKNITIVDELRKLSEFTVPEELNMYLKNNMLYVNNIAIDYYPFKVLFMLDASRTKPIAGKKCEVYLLADNTLKLVVDDVAIYPKYITKFVKGGYYDNLWEDKTDKTDE
ncbi:MAG TPA: hypothetical protein PK390_03875 [Fervidobacterium nodosum]|nr:hypothetical protein [Fervidobacterium nodosum]